MPAKMKGTVMRFPNPGFKSIAQLALVFAIACASSSAQQNQSAANKAGEKLNSGAESLTPAQIDNIILKFTAKETEFRRALNTYAFKRDALIQILGMGGQVVGEYHRVSE